MATWRERDLHSVLEYAENNLSAPMHSILVQLAARWELVEYFVGEANLQIKSIAAIRDD